MGSSVAFFGRHLTQNGHNLPSASIKSYFIEAKENSGCTFPIK